MGDSIRNHYPYTDFHELNLDFLLEKMRELSTRLEEISGAFYKDVEKSHIATPYFYGAKGDGVHDDTKALNKCFSSEKTIFIPKGYYKITSTLHLKAKDTSTVLCDNKAVFMVDGAFNSPVVINITDADGESFAGVKWTGGIINMNGVENITGIDVNASCQHGIFEGINIVDVGNNSIGIHYSRVSGKNYFNQIFIEGSTYNFDISDIGGSMSLIRRDLTRNNIGFYSEGAFDYSIGNLYCLAVQKGIYATTGAQVDVKQYHYWLGTDNASNTIPWNIYKETRAFVQTSTSSGHWHFNQFYPDKPYIAWEGRSGSSDNTHYICPPVECFSDVQPDQAHCFLAKLTSSYGYLQLNEVTVNQSNRIQFRGIDYHTDINLTRDSVVTNWLYPFKPAYIHPSLNMNECDGNLGYTMMRGSAKNLIGYICLGSSGHCTIEFMTPYNVLTGYVDILTKSYGADIRGRMFKASQEIAVKFGMGEYQEINGYRMAPVYLTFENDSETGQFSQYLKAKGSAFFIPTEGVFSGNVYKEIILYGENDRPIKASTSRSDQLSITTGVHSFNIEEPPAIDGYTRVSGMTTISILDSTNVVGMRYNRSSGNCTVNNFSSSTQNTRIEITDLYVRNN